MLEGSARRKGQRRVALLCGHFGYSKQAYYRGQRAGDKLERECYLLWLVRDIREDMPNLGGVKLWKKLNSSGVQVGRDELYRLLRAHDLMVKHEKRRVVTTDSSGWFRQFPNLVKGLEIKRPNQVWVSDITYVDTLSGFVFLSLVTDAYSRRIMGWFVHDKLNTEGPLNALYRAFLLVRASEIEGTIHHSDRGVQYCSYQYNTTLGMKRMNTSMTQDGSPYDNAIAERVNGILKREWLEQEVFVNIEQVWVRVEKVVALYNGQRPHFSIGLNTPDSIYRDLTGKFAFHMY